MDTNVNGSPVPGLDYFAEIIPFVRRIVMSLFPILLKCSLARVAVRGTAASVACLMVLAAAPRRSVAQELTPAATSKTAQAPLNLAGLVSDVNGSPLPQATVYVYTAAPRTGTSPFCPSCYVDCGKHEVTNAQGRFLISAVSSSLIFRLLVVEEGYEPTFVPHVDPSHNPIKVVLKKSSVGSHDPLRRAAGRVFDPVGLPVAGATIEPVGLKTGTSTTYGQIEGLDPLAITNAHGEFQFQCPSAGSTLIALVKARGMAPQIVSTLDTGARVPQDVVLTYGTTVAGTVQDAGGKKMTGVTVQVVPADRNAATFVGWFEIGTDQEGRFSLPNIPVGEKYVVCVRMDSLTASGMGMARQVITTGKRDTVTGGVRLAVRPAAAIRGRVVLTDGAPIHVGTRIMLSRAETWDQQQAVLAEDGSFTFQGVPREEDLELIVQVPAHHYAPTTSGYDPIYHTVRLKIPAASSKADIQIALAPNAK